eukprot:gb/GECG01011006.1/.p1 GENE.gb/GECG01011006.1/~~gb/GECG01011006.1/.p1  ORF type:complete len:373 (+),score=39.75 gb/GECG01011006.1/:1-1119(+)
MTENAIARNGRLDIDQLHDLFLFYCHRRRDSHIEARLTDNITSGKLRQQHGRKHDKIALQPFLKFVNEAPQLLDPHHFTQQQAKLVFSQCLGFSSEQKWELNFSQFQDALLAIAGRRFPSARDDVEAFENLMEYSIYPLYIRLFGYPDDGEVINTYSAPEEESVSGSVHSMSTKRGKRPSMLVQTPSGVMPQYMANQRGLTSVDAHHATGRRSSRAFGAEGGPRKSSMHSASFTARTQTSSNGNHNPIGASMGSYSSANMNGGKIPPGPPPIRDFRALSSPEREGTNHSSRTPLSLDRIAEGDADEEKEERVTRVVEATREVQEKNSVNHKGPSKEHLLALLQDFVEITGDLLKRNRVRCLLEMVFFRSEVF